MDVVEDLSNNSLLYAGAALNYYGNFSLTKVRTTDRYGHS
jgi:hypothetical protein